MNKTVLVVLDTQNGFVRPGATQNIIPSIVNLLRRWSDLGGDLVFTRFINLPASQFERLIGWTRLAGRPETDLVIAVQPFAKTIIDKNYYSAFNESFRRMASRKGWSTFALCGVDTDNCVLKTAADAFELGYTPLVIEDACATTAGQEVNDAALEIIRRLIGRHQVLTSELFLAKEGRLAEQSQYGH